ncbi:MAG: PQQ-binding-like beta-propeller repeat protein [Pyrinomonadaceae bacterium]
MSDNHLYSKHTHLLLLAIVLAATASFAHAQSRNRAATATTATRQQETPPLPHARIRWSGEQGVTRYRLQLARDEQFTDIVFDRAVTGREYIVTGLAPGNYFWRVAPAAGETGRYSAAAPVQIVNPVAGGSPLTPVRSNVAVLMPSANSGWRTATGNVPQPVAAHLRDAFSYDLVGVNSDGAVYALNGTTGIALWTTRFRLTARRGEPTGNGDAPDFAPLIIASVQKPVANVVVAFEGGVRALEGATGRELWRAKLDGRAASGVVLSPAADGVPEIAIADNGTRALVILNGDTGAIRAQVKLDALIIGAPVGFNIGTERAIVLALANGIIDLRNASGKSLHAVRFDAAITTAPLIVQTAGKIFLMVGTEKGLVALNGADLSPLWRVATEKIDAPRGTLAAADLDNDSTPEVVMITHSGRTVALNFVAGKIKWVVPGATDADSATFADLNGDGTLDVIVAAVPAFALGLDGHSGETIWRADEQGGLKTPAGGSSGGSTTGFGRMLVATAVNANAAFIIGSDPAHTGLRAVELPRGAVKTANR